MTVRFNRLIRPGESDTLRESAARFQILRKSADQKMIFMSHKTGDRKAETEAIYISSRHSVLVYMAEWDDDVYGDSAGLPDHIMNAIKSSDGFLLHVIPNILASMWIGYEIGGAHAMEKIRAKIMYQKVYNLPSVVSALHTLGNRNDLDYWVRVHVL